MALVAYGSSQATGFKARVFMLPQREFAHLSHELRSSATPLCDFQRLPDEQLPIHAGLRWRAVRRQLHDAFDTARWNKRSTFACRFFFSGPCDDVLLLFRFLLLLLLLLQLLLLHSLLTGGSWLLCIFVVLGGGVTYKTRSRRHYTRDTLRTMAGLTDSLIRAPGSPNGIDNHKMLVPDPPLAPPAATNGIAIPVGLEKPSPASSRNLHFQLGDDQPESKNGTNRFLINGHATIGSFHSDAHAPTLPQTPAPLPFSPSVATSTPISNNGPPRAVHFNGAENLPHSNGDSVPSLKAIPLSSYYKLQREPSLHKMSEPDAGPEDAPAVKLPRRESTTEAPPIAPANGIHNKILEQVVRTPGRQPSPQPTHLSVPGPPSRILHEHGSGYVAPRFEGKESQMDQGKRSPKYVQLCRVKAADTGTPP